MDLSDLPLELIELIAGHLSLKDICSCSAVSTRWRNAFDSNRVWKRFCTFHPKYFDVQINKLECTEGIDFYKGCEARERFFKELFVRRNLVNGNSVSCKVKDDDLYIDNILEVVDDLGNHWLFCSCMETYTFEGEHFLKVWNLNDTPVLYTSVQTPLGRVKRLFDSKMKMVADKLIFIDEDLVIVYLFSPPHYELHLLHQFSTLSSRKSDIKKIIPLGSNIIRVSSHRNHCIPLLIELWNIDSALIFKGTVPFPRQELSVLIGDQSFDCLHGFHVISNNLDRVAIYLRLTCDQKEVGFSVLVFNVQRVRFMKFNIFVLGVLLSVEMSETSICMCYSKPTETKHVYIDCYNSDTGQNIYKCVLHNELRVRNNISAKLILSPGARELIVLIKNKVHAYNIKCKSKIIDFYVQGELMNVSILTKNILLLQCFSDYTYWYEIWNFKSGQKLYNLDYSIGFFNNKLTFSFIKNYVSPPKLIGVTNSEVVYPRVNATSKLFVTSFW